MKNQLFNSIKLFLLDHKLEIFILFSACFAPYFVLINNNFEQLIFADITQILVILLILFFLSLLGIYVVNKLFPKTSHLIFISVIILIFSVLNFEVLYSDVVVALFWDKYIGPQNHTIISLITNKKLIFIYLNILLIFLILMLIRFDFFKVFIFVFCLSVLAIPVTEIIFKGMTSNDSNIQNPNFDNRRSNTDKALDRFSENVYFIMLDGYSSESTLKEMGYDNSGFYEYLDDRGFIKLSEKGSYNTTYLALAGIFQLNYVIEEGDPKYINRRAFYPNMFRQKKPPKLIEELNDIDYKLIFSGNGSSGCYPVHIECITQPSFFKYATQAFLQETIFGRLMNNFNFDAISIINEQLKENAITPRESKYYFMHHSAPHPPYLSDDCLTAKGGISNGWEPPSEYLKTLNCVNNQVTEFINNISQHDPTALVIIQSDHGPETNRDWLHKEVNDPNIYIENRSNVINYIKVPHGCKKWLREDLRPINTSRFVLSCLRNQPPIYLQEKTFRGFYETHENYGTVQEVEY